MVVCVCILPYGGPRGSLGGPGGSGGVLGGVGGVPGRFRGGPGGALGKRHFLFFRGEFVVGLMQY